jgi:hypothetical protein
VDEIVRAPRLRARSPLAHEQRAQRLFAPGIEDALTVTTRSPRYSPIAGNTKATETSSRF